MNPVVIALMVAVVAVIFLAPFLGRFISDSDEPGPVESAVDRLDTIRQTISGFWPR